MCELLIQSQARSRGKGSRADAKADAWEKEEQAVWSSREERSGGLCGFVPTQGVVAPAVTSTIFAARKSYKTKTHEKRIVFHGFLLF